MNDVLKRLIRVSGMGYQIEDYQEIIAKAKASADMPEDAKTEIIGFAEKVLKAENKRAEAVAALLVKYNTAENIQPDEDDDGDDFF